MILREILVLEIGLALVLISRDLKASRSRGGEGGVDEYRVDRYRRSRSPAERERWVRDRRSGGEFNKVYLICKSSSVRKGWPRRYEGE